MQLSIAAALGNLFSNPSFVVQGDAAPTPLTLSFSTPSPLRACDNLTIAMPDLRPGPHFNSSDPASVVRVGGAAASGVFFREVEFRSDAGTFVLVGGKAGQSCGTALQSSAGELSLTFPAGVLSFPRLLSGADEVARVVGVVSAVTTAATGAATTFATAPFGLNVAPQKMAVLQAKVELDGLSQSRFDERVKAGMRLFIANFVGADSAAAVDVYPAEAKTPTASLVNTTFTVQVCLLRASSRLMPQSPYSTPASIRFPTPTPPPCLSTFKP